MSIRELAAYGRKGDNNLLHVSNRELHGLEAITGRRFTKNPHTGLPEAFGFADLLPVAAGIAGTVVSGGNPLVGAAAAGATRTGVSATQGKDMGSALMDGVMAGATSYATAGIMEGIGSMGVPADAVAATNAVPAAGGAPAVAGTANLATPLPTTLPADAASLLPASPLPQTAQAAFRGADFGGQMSHIGNAIQNDPTAALGKFVSPQGAVALGGTAMQLSGGMAAPPEIAEEDYSRKPPVMPGPRGAKMPGPGYRPGIDPEHRYFAAGGVASLPEGSNPDSARNLMNEATAAVLGEHPDPQRALSRFASVFGDEAVSALRDRVTAGRVRGAGGGLDDLVPGDIEGRQDVRLADGEFVIPADVVSHLGDGSTDHGVRRLHEMMDRVRKTKTGRVEQPGPVSDEAMPA